MRIATFNVNGLRARIEYLQHWLRAVEPDVVGLQELKLEDDAFPHEVFAALGYRALTHGQRSWNGVAILSRQEARTRQVGLPGQEEMGARLIAAEVGGLTFCTVYCPNGKDLDHEDYPRKLAWLDGLASWLETACARDEPLVVCGDFNVVPAPIDSWNEARFAGHIFHTEAERARLSRLLDFGLVDLYRATHPSEPGHTWWDYRAGSFHKREGLRIDLVLGTAPIAARVSGAYVSRDWRKKVEGLTPSDHTPVWVDLV